MTKAGVILCAPFMGLGFVWVLCRIYDVFAWMGVLPPVGN